MITLSYIKGNKQKRKRERIRMDFYQLRKSVIFVSSVFRLPGCWLFYQPVPLNAKHRPIYFHRLWKPRPHLFFVVSEPLRAVCRPGNLLMPKFYNYNLIYALIIPAPAMLLPPSNERLILPSLRLSHCSLLQDRQHLFRYLHVIIFQYL